jgi:hypothetical protein
MSRSDAFVCGGIRWAVEGMEEWMVGCDAYSGEHFFQHHVSGEIRLQLFRTCWEEVRLIV